MEALRESKNKSSKKSEEMVSKKVQHQHIYKYRISIPVLKYNMLSKIELARPSVRKLMCL